MTPQNLLSDFYKPCCTILLLRHTRMHARTHAKPLILLKDNLIKDYSILSMFWLAQMDKTLEK